MDIENMLLGILNGAGEFNFNTVIYAFLISLAMIWLFTTVWVWTDSGDRTSNLIFRIASILLVLPFNIPGLIVYLIIRPKDTIEGIYWSDLERRYLMYETAELGDCAECGFQLRPGFNVCPNCSYNVKAECESCKIMIDKEWQFCPFCSYEQSSLSVDKKDVARKLVRMQPSHTKSEVVKEEETVAESATSLTEPEPTPSPGPKELTEELVAETASNDVPASSDLAVAKDLPAAIETETKVVEEDVVADEEVISKEEMGRRVQLSHDHMVDTVENKGTRYKVSSGVSVRIGKAVMRQVLAFGKGINDLFMMAKSPKIASDPANVSDEIETVVETTETATELAKNGAIVSNAHATEELFESEAEITAESENRDQAVSNEEANNSDDDLEDLNESIDRTVKKAVKKATKSDSSRKSKSREKRKASKKRNKKKK